MPNNFLRLLYSWANFSLMAELVSWGNNLKTKIKMPDGNISSQSKAVRHFGHWVTRFGQCSLSYSEVDTASTRKIKLPVLSAVLADSILLRLVAGIARSARLCAERVDGAERSRRVQSAGKTAGRAETSGAIAVWRRFHGWSLRSRSRRETSTHYGGRICRRRACDF